MRGAEGNGGPKERGPELVVVGHVGTSIVHAGAASRTAAGGSGYAVAASAGALIGDRAGLVAAVGKDVDLTPLRSRRVDLDGVIELPGPSAKLWIREFDDDPVEDHEADDA
jgi:sugar/nucleoside kinase (ribokinase family)